MVFKTVVPRHGPVLDDQVADLALGAGLVLPNEPQYLKFELAKRGISFCHQNLQVYDISRMIAHSTTAVVACQEKSQFNLPS